MYTSALIMQLHVGACGTELHFSKSCDLLCSPIFPMLVQLKHSTSWRHTFVFIIALFNSKVLKSFIMKYINLILQQNKVRQQRKEHHSICSFQG